MSRRLRTTLVVAACLVVLGGVFLWALPEIVRRVALHQIPKLTGRVAAIGDIDLNLFTGHLAIKGFRLAEREGGEPFVEFERLDVRLSRTALLRSHVRVSELALAKPSVRIVRTGPADFNFSDLLRPSRGPEGPPSRWTITVERLGVSGGRVLIDDRAVSPAAEWLIQDLGVDAAGITTRAGAPPGRLTVRARINESALSVTADPLGLDPLQVSGRLAFDGFEMRRLDPYVYVPLRTPYLPRGGRLTLALTAQVDSDAEGVKKAGVSGSISLEGQAMAQVGRQDPFLTTSRVGIEIKEANILSRSLTVAGVDIDGLDLKVRRDTRGVVDLIEMFTPKASSAPAAARSTQPAGTAQAGARPPAPQPRRLFPLIQALARGFEQIRVERITLAPSTATFIDEAVTPTTTLALTKLQARIDDFTWPVTGPAALTLSTALPGGGTLNARGPVIALPFDVDVTLAVRDAPVEPYQAYIPLPARLSGRYYGDSRNHIAFRDGRLLAASTGNSWAQNVEIRAPGSEPSVIRVERMDLVGIDLDWPQRAAVVKAGFRRLRVAVEREADGSFNLRRLFTAPGAQTTTPASTMKPRPEPAPPPRSSDVPKPKGLLETMQLDFREVRIEDGFVRFLDRTTTPAFSEDLSRLALTLTGYGNRPDRRAKLSVQSVVGGDAALDIRGELGALGAPVFIELVGELRSFKLPSVDPYATAATGWVIKKGELQYKMRFKLDGDQITAENDVVVGALQVAPASGGDEVKRRIGLPLGLIVALVKDGKGDIRANVPVSGSVKDPKFDLSETIWTAVKNVLVNLVTAPFKAIGRLFSGGEKIEEPKVDPVTFAAGSSVLSPAMEEHLLRVGDFLRRTPFVNLALTSATSAADADALRGDMVTARLREFQKERGLADAALLVAYYRARLPAVTAPATVEERLALLREREPVPDALLVELGRRRVEATRQRLLTAEGIPADRLIVGEPAPGSPAAATPAAPAEGRVEFGIAAGG